MDGAVGKLQMFTDPWYAAFDQFLAAAVRSRADQLAGVAFSMCETITDCPDGGSASHWFRVKDGQSVFGRGAPEDTDARLTVPYPLACLIGRTPMADLAEARATATTQGELHFEGLRPDALPQALTDALREVHDRLAAIVI